MCNSQEVEEANSKNFAAPVNYMSTIAEKELIVSDISNKQEAKKNLFENEKLVPFDLSLKTRCRFLSKQPFSCSTAVKSHHESQSILNYAKFNVFYDSLDKHRFVNDHFRFNKDYFFKNFILKLLNKQSVEENRDLFKTLFGEATSYWTFPYLPWLNLYPRNSNNSNRAAEPLNADILKSLSKSW